MASFVKFLRGSATAYERLAIKDKDTLYFIYENPEDTTGSLYLGTKLICGPNGVGATALTELSDVNINPTLLREGMILQYNGTTNAGTWEAVSLQTAIENANVAINSSVSSGETEEGESRQDAIDRLISDPHTGDIVFIDNFSYIYDGTEWKPLSVATNLEDRVDALEFKVGEPATLSTPATGLYAAVGSLETELHNNYYTKSEVNEAIANANHLTYRPVAALEDIDLTAPASQNTIFLVPHTGSLADDKYDEYLVVDNKLEKVGKLDVDLTNYVLKTEVGDLSQLRHHSTTLVEEINLISDILVWHPIDEH